VTRVLVVEDEASFSDPLSYMLRKEGFDVAVCATGPDAIEAFDRSGADLVLLDLMLPGLPGSEVCRALRERSNVPVIMLTAKDGEIDKVVGLELGADDYIAKPFHPDELAARVRAVLRRASGVAPGSGIVHLGPVDVDLERRLVTRDGKLVSLSRTEWLLLQHLVVNAGKVVLHTELLTKVWGPEYRDDLQYLRVWISRVRRKLGAAPGEPGPITTFQGIGYVLNADDPSADPPSEVLPPEADPTSKASAGAATSAD